MQLTYRDALIRLAYAPGIGPVTIRAVISSTVTGSEYISEWLATASAAELEYKCRISKQKSTLVWRALRDETYTDAMTRFCSQPSQHIVTYLDEHYPFTLQQIAVPPPVLWLRGTLPAESMCLCAIVGSRHADAYGIRTTKYLARELAAVGVGVISGGAQGVDGAAHHAMVEQGGYTAVITGCGLYHTYPQEHADLFNTVILHGGALISPFAPDVAPVRGNFPARNRIIAGLVQMCVVVQAAVRSGALITATYALDEGRDVGAVPGPVDHPLHEGTHMLLKQGAQMVTSAADITACIGTTIMNRTCDGRAPLSPLLGALTVALSVEELAATLQRSPGIVQQELSALQLEGKVSQNIVGQWECCE